MCCNYNTMLIVLSDHDFPRHFSKLCSFLRHFSTALFQYHFFPSLFECTFSKPSTFSVHFSKPFSFFKAKMLIDHGYYDFYNPNFMVMADVEFDRLEKLAEFANRCYMSFEDKHVLGERHDEYMI